MPAWFTIHIVPVGGKRYSAVAKIRYTISASAPTNQAERPDPVTSAAVSVANRIIATAPGHKFKSIGAGPIK